MTDHEAIGRLFSEYHKHDKMFYQKEKNLRIHWPSIETCQMPQTSRSVKSEHLW